MAAYVSVVEWGVEALLLEEADDGLTALPARGVLTARRVPADVARHAHRREHLLLLGTQRGGVERDGLLHRRERKELQEVVLDDVARGAMPS